MYRLTGRLDQGQLADLFRGERVDASESVLIKLFHRQTTDVDYAASISTTGHQLGSLATSGIAHVLDVGLVDGQLAIVQQDLGTYTLGVALQRLNTREVILPPALALAVTLELLQIIGTAHDAGVVHGALTPGNVWLANDGAIGINDFGARTALRASATLEKSFGSKGRTSYLAPETGEAPTIAGDIYAIGAIAYELLTLREATTGNSAVSTRSERLPPPSRLVRRLHSRIDPILMRALETNPTRRHRSCAEFAAALRDFLLASGGVPPRDDLRTFVGQLFPNEVKMAVAGPVPFSNTFSLGPVGEVTLRAAAVEPAIRPSFSAGPVDDRTDTSDGLPVFTQPETPAYVPKPIVEWDAPAASPESQKGPTPQVSAQASKNRLKMVEDFAVDPAAPKPPPKQTRRQKVAKTIMTFAVPFKREGDPSVPSYEAMHRRGRKQVRIVSFLATIILFATVTGSAYLFLRSTSDPRATLIGYLPIPIQRQFFSDEKPPRPAPPKNTGPPLQQFDKLHPDKAFQPNGPTTPPVVTPVKKDPPPPPPQVQVVKKPAGNCYDAPTGSTGFLTVEPAKSVKVQIDGKPSCQGATKIPVAPGSHKVTITEIVSRESTTQTQRFEAGKTVKLAVQVRTR